MTLLRKPHTKGRRQTLRRQRMQLSRAENVKVRRRSGGRCEAILASGGPLQGAEPSERRCLTAATEIHHLVGGIGRRDRGDSLLAAQKLHVCHVCHVLITEHRIVLDASVPWVRYQIPPGRSTQ